MRSIRIGEPFLADAESGGKVDYERPTQVGRAMKELGVQMIPSYSPQARGRSERNFSTWQGRLPQELRLRGIRTLEAANEFLSEHYIAEFNRRFTVPAAQRGTAFISAGTGIWRWSLRNDSSAPLIGIIP